MQAQLINTAYISVGSNMGDSLENCRNALAELDKSESARVISVSRFYHTAPMEYPDQPWFVNAAARIQTSLNPLQLLVLLKSFEVQFGRKKNGLRFGPRPLDFDIIFYDDMVMNTPELEIPHPRMHHREFVLRPISDLAPDFLHPMLNKSICQLLGELSTQNQQCIVMDVASGE